MQIEINQWQAHVPKHLGSKKNILFAVKDFFLLRMLWSKFQALEEKLYW